MPFCTSRGLGGPSYTLAFLTMTPYTLQQRALRDWVHVFDV
jgi:hypothetical protein